MGGFNVMDLVSGLDNMMGGKITEFMLGQQDPRLQAFYNGLGDEQKGHFREIMTDPKVVQALSTGEGSDPAMREAMLNRLQGMTGTQAGNTLIDTLYEKPELREALLGLPPGSDPATPAVAATDAATPGANTPAAGGLDLHNILGGVMQTLMASPLMQFLGTILEKVFGVSLQDMAQSAEVMISGDGPTHAAGGPFDFLRSMFSPTASVHDVNPQNGQISTTLAGTDPNQPQQDAALRNNPQLTQAQPQGLSMTA